jgi:hypothetical protein
MSNLKRVLRKKTKGAITTYVMMMFGMIIVMYLMGFTNPYVAYTSSQNQDLPPLTDEDGEVIRDDEGNIVYADVVKPGGIGTSLLDWIMSGIKGLFEGGDGGGNAVIAIIASIVTVIGFWVLSKVGGQYVLAYLIPIIVLALFANIFFFPTASLQGTPIVFPFDFIVFGFLNLFLILSCVEFIKGSA